jgi:predicted dehydrogenase
MVGYGFMGRRHSNAWRKVSNFFDTGYQPVLKAVAARKREKAQAFAETWGYESVETDWRRWSSATTSTPSTSARPTTPMPRSPSRRRRPAR